MAIWIIDNSRVPALEAQPCLSSSKSKQKTVVNGKNLKETGEPLLSYLKEPSSDLSVTPIQAPFV